MTSPFEWSWLHPKKTMVGPGTKTGQAPACAKQQAAAEQAPVDIACGRQEQSTAQNNK